MQLFYHPNPETQNAFSPEESKHIAKVLRYREGQFLICTDGIGNKYELALTHTHYEKVVFQVISKEIVAADELQIHIGIGIIKSEERTEWMLEKLVELGVSSISLLQTERTESKPIKETRAHKILLSAIKQSKRYHLPTLHTNSKFKDFVIQQSDCKIIAHLIENEPTKNLKSYLNTIPTPSSVHILIGPEGDFTKAEVDDALSKQYNPVTLGNYVLRTETAAMAIVAGVRATLEQ